MKRRAGIIAVILVILIFTARTWMGARRGTTTRTHHATSTSPSRPAQPSATRRPTEPSATPSPSPVARTPEEREAFRKRLLHFRDWLRATLADGKRAERGEIPLKEFLDRSAEERDREMAGMKRLILGDPEIFLEFIKVPENEDCYASLMGLLRAEDFGQGWGALPQSLTTGLMEIFKTGTPNQRRTAIGFLSTLQWPPEEYKQICYGLLEERDDLLVQLAVNTIVTEGWPMPASQFPALKRAAGTEPSGDCPQGFLRAMITMNSPEADAFVLACFEREASPVSAGFMMGTILKLLDQPTPQREEGVEKALSSGLRRFHASEVGIRHMVTAALDLPAWRTLRLVGDAMTLTDSAKLRAALEEVDRLLRSGETSKEPLKKALERD